MLTITIEDEIGRKTSKQIFLERSVNDLLMGTGDQFVILSEMPVVEELKALFSKSNKIMMDEFSDDEK